MASQSYVVVEVVNPIFTRFVSPANLIQKINDECLSYKAVTWNEDRFGRKTKRHYTKPLIRNSLFLSGFLPRLKLFVESLGMTLTVEHPENLVPVAPAPKSPHLTSMEIRPEQEKIIERIHTHTRGVIKASTGSGKTAIAMGLVSCYPKAKILFLVHTRDLMEQTWHNFTREKLGPISLVEGGKTDLGGRIIIGTRQSFVKIPERVYEKLFDIVVVDEIHHLSDFRCEYARILRATKAPIRIGLTATPPQSSEEAVMSVEGHIGPIIATLSIEKGTKLGILSVPTVILVPVPVSTHISDLKRYPDIYDVGIVWNKDRNDSIAKMVKGFTSEGKSCLVIVTKVDHGNELVNVMAERDTPSIFVHGNIKSDMRTEIKEALNRKDIKCVVADVVWREGVDIPQLDVVINAGGGKDENRTIQTIGRGLRRTETKDTVTLVDFLDTPRYLAEHTVYRITTYIKQGWEIGGEGTIINRRGQA